MGCTQAFKLLQEVISGILGLSQLHLLDEQHFYLLSGFLLRGSDKQQSPDFHVSQPLPISANVTIEKHRYLLALVEERNNRGIIAQLN